MIIIFSSTEVLSVRLLWHAIEIRRSPLGDFYTNAHGQLIADLQMKPLKTNPRTQITYRTRRGHAQCSNSVGSNPWPVHWKWEFNSSSKLGALHAHKTMVSHTLTGCPAGGQTDGDSVSLRAPREGEMCDACRLSVKLRAGNHDVLAELLTYVGRDTSENALTSLDCTHSLSRI